METKDLVNYEKQKPPNNENVLFVWWHRLGIKTSQMSVGYYDSKIDDYISDLTFNKPPTFWHKLF